MDNLKAAEPYKRISELEAALQSILDIDPLSFIGKGDAANQGSAHLQLVHQIVRTALNKQ